MNVPLLDLKKEYQSLKEEIVDGMLRVLGGMQLYEGENIKRLEEEFASYCGAKYAVGVGSGTEALYFALLAFDIGPGDEVITVSHTFIATVAAIAFTGARPVFVDINPRTYTMDVSQIEEAINKRTKAIIPVHLYGQPVDMEPVMKIARNRGLMVIEDACQAHGAEYRGRKVGAIGDVGCFSFVYTKLLNAYGDAGILVARDDRIAERVRLLHDHGRSGKYTHVILGLNGRLDEIHASTLRIKLRTLEERISKRRRVASIYNKALESTNTATPYEMPFVRHSYWHYVVRTKRRDELAAWLSSRGVSNSVDYPIPCHLQEACKDFGYKEGSLPETEKAVREILSLPIYPELEPEQVHYVIDLIKQFDEGRIGQ